MYIVCHFNCLHSFDAFFAHFMFYFKRQQMRQHSGWLLRHDAGSMGRPHNNCFPEHYAWHFLGFFKQSMIKRQLGLTWQIVLALRPYTTQDKRTTNYEHKLQTESTTKCWGWTARVKSQPQLNDHLDGLLKAARWSAGILNLTKGRTHWSNKSQQEGGVLKGRHVQEPVPAGF